MGTDANLGAIDGGGALRVLVVDDETDLAMMCRMLLEGEGHEAVTVGAGEAAIEHLAAHPTDLVVLDLTLPGMSGWEVLACIRDDPATADLPVIIATASANTEIQRRAWLVGANAFLAKPFDDVRLLAAVRQAVGLVDRSARVRHGREMIDRIVPPAAVDATEARLESLVDLVSDVVIRASPAGYIDMWNVAAERALGYTAAEAIGSTFELLVPDRADVLRLAARYTTDGTVPDPAEALWISKEGAPVRVHRAVVPITDAEGHAAGWWVVASVLREANESPYRDVLDAAPDAVVVVDESRRITLFNHMAERMFGYRRDEVQGQPSDVLLPERLRRSFGERKIEFYRDPRPIAGGIDVQVYGRHQDGREFPVEVNASPLRTPRGTFVCLVIRDITDRRRDEALFRQLLEAAPDAMVIADDRGHISLVNARAEQLFGYDRSELVGQPAGALLHEPGDGPHRWEPPPPDGVTHERSLVGERSDGTAFPIDVSYSHVAFHGGTLVSAAIRDATERTREHDVLAEAFAREQEALEHMRDLDRQRSDFISTVSHELRTPLTVVMGFAKMLVGRWDSLDDETRRHLLGRIAASGQKLEQLIADMLDIARLERGHLDVALEPRSLWHLTEESIAKVQVLLDEHALAIDVDEELTVVADEFAFTRVLENLLTNAAKFSPEGSTIHVVARRVDDQVDLTVTDEGPGIAEEDRARVFDRFTRLPGQSQVVPGTGIGLAIAKEYVEAQHGRIWVEQGETGGSAFHFTLPHA